MERKFVVLLSIFGVLVFVSSFLVAAPLPSLSTILGISVLGSSVLGSSVLASTTIIESYRGAIPTAQIALSLASIGLLISLQLTDPIYGHTRNALLELRRSWLPVSALLVILFLLIIGLKIWSALVV